MNTKCLIRQYVVAGVVLLTTGCTSIVSNPPGAMIQNAVKSNYQTVQGFQGYFATPHSILAIPGADYFRARWPDGTISEWQTPAASGQQLVFDRSHAGKTGKDVVGPSTQPGSHPPAHIVSKERELPRPPVRGSRENIAVADLTAYTLSQGEVKTLTEKLHTALVETEYFNVLSRADMKAVLDAQQFSKNDACDDSSCLVEMGKILAVQKIVGGSIGKVGSTFSLSLRLVNVETGGTEVTTDRRLKAEPDELLDLVEDAARELVLKYSEPAKFRSDRESVWGDGSEPRK